MNKIIIDVCGTLYASNTTFDYIDFVMQSASLKKRVVHYILQLRITKLILITIGKIVKIDIYRYLYIHLLKGCSKDKLELYASRFYHEYLQKKRIQFSFDILDSIDNKKYSIILCSASLDIIIEKISHNIGYKYHATKLEFVSNICTGKIHTDLLGAKHLLFKNEDLYLVMTDNLSDYLLVQQAKIKLVLSKPKNIPFWTKKGIKVSHIFN